MIYGNNLVYLILSVSLVSSIIIFNLKRNLVYLHIFQQHEYDNFRMLKWIINNVAIDKRLSIALILIYFINLFIFYKFTFLKSYIKFVISCLLIVFTIASFSYIEKDPIKLAKKPLILTDRAMRIYYLALIFNFINIVILLSVKIHLTYYLIQLLLIIHLIPVYLIIANICLIPVENYIQSKYWKFATEQLSKCKPIIVGVTGSFGKTTVKHFLGHILQQVDHTLITRGSINTPMGIVKTIREELNPSYKYFIVEMGAYKIGSINTICQLTPPNFGIITAVGSAHYERFKSLENVAQTKFELVEAVIKNLEVNVSPESNVNTVTTSNNTTNQQCNIIINQQVLNTNYAKKYTEEHKSFIKILESNAITNVEQLKTGLTWNLNIEGVNYKIVTPIFGGHNVINISLACLAAYNLKVPMQIILNALKTMPQVSHRLEIKQQNNYTIIDDSYNANPDGFRSGLELMNFLYTSQEHKLAKEQVAKNSLDNFNNQGIKNLQGRRILITPGLIELGDKHEEEHFNLGKLAAKYVDILLIINSSRVESFLFGFKENSTVNQQIINLDVWQQAQSWLNANCKDHDVVLIANDLPDSYESKIRI